MTLRDVCIAIVQIIVLTISGLIASVCDIINETFDERETIFNPQESFQIIDNPRHSYYTVRFWIHNNSEHAFTIGAINYQFVNLETGAQICTGTTSDMTVLIPGKKIELETFINKSCFQNINLEMVDFQITQMISKYNDD